MRIILLGAPGAGKGTQAILLSKKLNIPQISIGDIFRHNLKNETSLGKIAKGYMDEGFLVPDEITVSIVQDRLAKDDCKNGFILDGFPRTLSQAERLETMLNEMGISLNFAINFNVTDEVVVKRLTGRRVCPTCGKTFHIENEAREDDICDICHISLTQRPDDKEATVKKRLLSYHEQTVPLIDYYQRRNMLVIINAMKRIDVISSEIMAAI